MDNHRPPRSYLFVPADRGDRIAKALASGADAVIVDLEDAVAPQAKVAARASLAAWLEKARRASVLVRVNGPGTAWFEDDVALCQMAAVMGVVVPKAERAEQLAYAHAAVPRHALLPLVETAAGLDAVRALASAPGVQRLVFGALDFQVDLGIDDDGDALLLARSQLVLASRLQGLDAPVDGVTTALDDTAAVALDTARARRLGFGAKLCIHPLQVATVNQGFTPDAAQVDWARRVLAAAQASAGAAVAVDGRMVDAPVLLRARTLLRRAGQQT